MLGWEVLVGLSLVASCLAVCGQLVAFDRPTCYRCPALFLARLTLCFYASMLEASERTQSTERVGAQGRSRARAADQSLCLEKNRFA
jgi:hypothetical protein